MLTDKDLKIILDRCNKATSGPWKSFIEGRDHESGSGFIQTPNEDIELIGGTGTIRTLSRTVGQTSQDSSKRLQDLEC